MAKLMQSVNDFLQVHIDTAFVAHISSYLQGRYAQRRRNIRLERNLDFTRSAMLLNAQMSRIPTAT